MVGFYITYMYMHRMSIHTFDSTTCWDFRAIKEADVYYTLVVTHTHIGNCFQTYPLIVITGKSHSYLFWLQEAILEPLLPLQWKGLYLPGKFALLIVKVHSEILPSAIPYRVSTLLSPFHILPLPII